MLLDVPGDAPDPPRNAEQFEQAVGFGSFIETVINAVVRVLVRSFVERQQVGFIPLVGEIVPQVGGDFFGSTTDPEHSGHDEDFWFGVRVGLHAVYNTSLGAKSL